MYEEKKKLNRMVIALLVVIALLSIGQNIHCQNLKERGITIENSVEQNKEIASYYSTER